jgi:hypothetical protein
MGCFRLIVFFGFLAIGLGSVALLVKIGGTSDGPGALVFYIGAFVGLFGAWTALSAGRMRR